LTTTKKDISKDVPLVKRISNKLKAFPYYGGKHLLLPVLIAMTPPSHITIEACAGSATYTLNKPVTKVEVINDINSEVVNFFRVLRNKPDELIRLLKFTPYGRDEFLAARRNISFESCDVEKARKFFVKHQQSFAGAGNSYGFAVSKNQATTFRNRVESLVHVSERLRNVQIENKDINFMIEHYGKREDAFVYIDPPYMPETRVTKDNYEFEMDERQHKEMLELAVASPAKILISGYPTKLYDKYLKKWYRREIEISCFASYSKNKKTKPRRTEVLWWNYKI